eukprot:365916-Chlamydomonas_euryale.AAC.8
MTQLKDLTPPLQQRSTGGALPKHLLTFPYPIPHRDDPALACTVAPYTFQCDGSTTNCGKGSRQMRWIQQAGAPAAIAAAAAAVAAAAHAPFVTL